MTRAHEVTSTPSNVVADLGLTDDETYTLEVVLSSPAVRVWEGAAAPVDRSYFHTLSPGSRGDITPDRWRGYLGLGRLRPGPHRRHGRAMTDVLTAAVEVRSSAAGPMLRGTILQEGRAAAGGRAEVFAPGALVWPSDGIGILAEHRGAELARALPVRQADGRVTVETRATDAIRRAVDVDGRRYMSVEFIAHRENRTPANVREVLRATVDAAALVTSPEYSQAVAEVRERSRGPRVWL